MHKREMLAIELSKISDAESVYLRSIELRNGVLAGFLDEGWEIVDADSSEPRHTIHVCGVTLALSPEKHKARLDAAFEAAKEAQDKSKPDTKSVVGTEALSQMICHKCGDSLQHSAVCPKCAAGKIGYRHRYTCVCGGVDFVSKDKL